MTRSILALGTILLLGIPVAAQIQPRPTMNPPSPSAAPDSKSAPAAPGTQQKPAQEGDTRSYIKVHTEVVVVPVTVKDRDGRLVGGLQAEDFRIFQDGQEQQILKFSADPFPLSAVILIDNDLSQKQADQVQKSLVAIAGGFGPADEAAIVTYSEYSTVVSNFSFNNDVTFTALKRLELRRRFPGGFGGPLEAGPVINGRPQETGVPNVGAQRVTVDVDLDDAIYAAGEMLKGRGRDRRKIIFLISDGNNAHNNKHSFKETLQLLLTADVSVYSISVGHAFLQHETSRLEHYASGTGGDTFYAGKSDGLGRLYAKVTEQARNQYILLYSPQEADRSKDYHSIEVRVRRAGLDVSAREGYYTSAVNAPH
ncbi:MAG TPA: VWA domain-containing protein [Candidatus Limnocylindria bacterium]|nr:VWA domain-containing protein [Candidatus Limnocylindria bacterium]